MIIESTEMFSIENPMEMYVYVFATNRTYNYWNSTSTSLSIGSKSTEIDK
jgi:hypothetical protein